MPAPIFYWDTTQFSYLARVGGISNGGNTIANPQAITQAYSTFLTALNKAGSQVVIADAVQYEATQKAANGTVSNPLTAIQQLNQSWIKSNASDLTVQNTSYQTDIQNGYLPPDAGEDAISQLVGAQPSGTVYKVGSDNVGDFVNLGIPASNVDGVVGTMNMLQGTMVPGTSPGEMVPALDPRSYAALRDQLNAVTNINGQQIIPNSSSLQSDATLNVSPELNVDPANGTNASVIYRMTSAPEDPGRVAVDMTPTATPPVGEAPATAVTQDANQLVLDLGAGAGEGAISGGLTAAALEGLGKTLGVLGIAAVVVDLASSAEAAETDIQQGNNTAAATTMEQWAARTALALIGAELVIPAVSHSAPDGMHLSEMPLAA